MTLDFLGLNCTPTFLISSSRQLIDFLKSKRFSVMINVSSAKAKILFQNLISSKDNSGLRLLTVSVRIYRDNLRIPSKTPLKPLQLSLLP